MQRVDHSFKAMGGPARFRMEVDDVGLADIAVTAAVAEVERLERKYSRYLDDSLTSRINRAAGTDEVIPVDAETAGLLHYATTVWRESGGLFDLTSGVLRRAWDFRSGRLPEQSEIDAILPLVGWDKVRWDEQGVSLPLKDMELDFGGCVKEYAADSAAAQLQRHGVQCALVDLAGDMAAAGAPLHGPGWPIGIRHPRARDSAAATVILPQGGLASSGDYERCMEIDGVRYGHILNPTTGWPVGGLVAVSVLAEQCLVAGSAATVGMLKPASQGLEWLEGLGLPWLAIDMDLQCHGNLLEAGSH